MNSIMTSGLMLATMVLAGGAARASEQSERQAVGQLDTEFQAAVKRNDADTMARIFHENMTLVLGDGRIVSREEQLQQARDKVRVYEHQEEDPGTQSVRIWGDTAVVTARLWIKGSSNGAAFERRLWFSDTYVRTPSGWRYAFGQASLPLP